MIDGLHQASAEDGSRPAIYAVHPLFVVVPLIILPRGSAIVLGPPAADKLASVWPSLCAHIFSNALMHYGSLAMSAESVPAQLMQLGKM